MKASDDDLRKRILTRLGAGRRVIEFSTPTNCNPDAYDPLGEAMQQALDLINTFRNKTIPEFLSNVTEEHVKVELADDELLLRVTDVQFTRTRADNYNNMDEFALTNRTIIGRNYSGRQGGYGSSRVGNSANIIELSMQREAVQRAFGLEPDWHWDDDNKRLAIYCPGGPYDITYFKSYNYTRETLPEGFSSHFLKAAEGYARIILADIRGKFGAMIPGPTGGSSVESAEQRQRGETLVGTVEQSMQNMALMPGPEFG